MNKLPKSIGNRITEINSLLDQVALLDEYAYTYNGGTWPYYVDIEPIQVDGLKVTIKANDLRGSHNYIDVQEYDVTNDDYFNDYGLRGLKYDLSVILKALKKALK
jgi:hypothetical protein